MIFFHEFNPEDRRESGGACDPVCVLSQSLSLPYKGMHERERDGGKAHRLECRMKKKARKKIYVKMSEKKEARKWAEDEEQIEWATRMLSLMFVVAVLLLLVPHVLVTRPGTRDLPSLCPRGLHRKVRRTGITHSPHDVDQ